MPGYYSDRLSAERLRRCYEIAPARVRQYLAAEVQHVRMFLRPDLEVLELGCGYGRATLALAASARRMVGIDVAEASLDLARRLTPPGCPAEFQAMDATALAFPDRCFDITFCIQNGICAFHADEDRLVAEALRVTRPGGRVLFSTYAARFWEDRLAWFELQAAEGLLGPIDRERTGDGVIACQDGFSSGLRTPEALAALARRHGLEPRLVEVDASSLFLELNVPGTMS